VPSLPAYPLGSTSPQVTPAIQKAAERKEIAPSTAAIVVGDGATIVRGGVVERIRGVVSDRVVIRTRLRYVYVEVAIKALVLMKPSENMKHLVDHRVIAVLTQYDSRFRREAFNRLCIRIERAISSDGCPSADMARRSDRAGTLPNQALKLTRTSPTLGPCSLTPTR
jgi:hypothetical protein